MARYARTCADIGRMKRRQYLELVRARKAARPRGEQAPEAAEHMRGTYPVPRVFEVADTPQSGASVSYVLASPCLRPRQVQPIVTHEAFHDPSQG